MPSGIASPMGYGEGAHLLSVFEWRKGDVLKRIKDEQLLDLARDQTVVLGRIRRHVESKLSAPDERPRGIHPSELSRDDFCPKATFFAMSGLTPTKVEKHSQRLLSIFAEGSTIHDKWQGWAWSMGDLVGMFGCLLCKKNATGGPWWGTAPQICPTCGAGREYLKYLEIPVNDAATGIVGHADIRVGSALGELKSVAPGSVRIENERLYIRHTHEVEGRSLLDLDGMWRDLKRPFPSHIKQLQIYLHCTGLDTGFVLYEWKVNQAAKEFSVPYHQKTIAQELDICADIQYALKRDIPPLCPHDVSGCPKCNAYEEKAA